MRSVQLLHSEAPPSPTKAPSARVAAPRRLEFADVLNRLSRELTEGEKLVGTMARGGLAGRKLDSADLLALQAAVYRYSEIVDLGSKLVEKGTSAVKTVLQSSG